MKKRAFPKTAPPSGKISADIVEARCIHLVDDKGVRRAELSTGSSGFTMLQFYDSFGMARFTIQVDSEGNPGLLLWNENHSPAVSISHNEIGNGIGICGRDGVPYIQVGVPDPGHPEWPEQPYVQIRDHRTGKLWSMPNGEMQESE